jgi:hypothetical protein
MSDDAILAVAHAQHEPEKPAAALPGEAPLWREISALIERDMTDQPRSRQTRLGPSELGTDSLHTLAAKLAGWPRQHGAAWLPYIGTAVHARLERLFPSIDPDRFETEKRVRVGRLNGLDGGYDVTGSIDLYDKANAATIDWKIVGATTMKTVKAQGVSQQYLVQASLYGMGVANENLPIRRSCIYFLPRNAISLNDAIAWEADWDPAPGQWALSRAQLLANLLDLIEQEDGERARDAWIHQLPSSPTHDFADGTWPDDDPLGINGQRWPQTPDKWRRLIPLLEPTWPGPARANDTTEQQQSKER